MKSKLKMIAALSATMLLSACNTKPIEADPLNTDTKVADFSKEVTDFYASSGYGNGSPFNVEWDSGEAKVTNNELHLSIHENAKGKQYPYKAGEFRSKKFYGYGDFATRMKPSKTYGTASTFFTYTGEWDSETLHPSAGVDDTRNPDNAEGVHDEVDIEFLGKDTTKVQFNYFTKGKGGHEHMYNLGFDASLEYHDYGFRWEKDKITWFVDNKPVYQATKDIPSHPGRIVTNYWAGDRTAAGWMGNFKYQDVKDSTYQWFSTTSEGKETHFTPADPTPVDPSDWSDVDPVDLTLLDHDDVYTVNVSEDKKTAEVTYTAVAKESYKNVIFDIPSASRSANRVSFELKNKGASAMQVRADVNAATQHGPNNITSINTSANFDGTSVYTDTSWGGSKFDLAPGQSGVAEILFDGDPVNLLFMIDSAIYQDSVATHAGDLEIKNLKFANFDDEPETPTSEPEAPTSVEPEVPESQPVTPVSSEPVTPTSEPVTPTSEPATPTSEPEVPTSEPEAPVSSEPESSSYQLNFSGNGYTCTNEGGKSIIKYDAIKDNSYWNVFSNLENVPADANVLTMTIENKGAENVQFNIDLGTNSDSGIANRTVKSAEYDWFDEGNKRVQYNVGAGGTRTVNIYFDQTAGAVNAMLMFVNSSWAETTTTHTNGNIEISNVSFDTVA